MHVCLRGHYRPRCVLRLVLFRSDSLELKRPTPSLRNNKQSQEARLQQDHGRQWLHVADRQVKSIFQGFYADCFGVLILYIFGFENARTLLAEQVYPLFSKQAVSHWGLFLKNSRQTLLPTQHTVQWDGLNLRQVLSKILTRTVWKQTLKQRCLDLLSKLTAKSRRTSTFLVHRIHERRKPTGQGVCREPPATGDITSFTGEVTEDHRIEPTWSS